MAKKIITPPPQNEQPVVLKLELEPNQVIFEVTDNLCSLAHGAKVYPVVSGKVILPANETWYDDMLKAGLLKLPA